MFEPIHEQDAALVIGVAGQETNLNTKPEHRIKIGPPPRDIIRVLQQTILTLIHIPSACQQPIFDISAELMEAYSHETSSTGGGG